MRFTTEDGIGIEYEVAGVGNPILCLPGLTRNASDFKPFVDAYSDKARIIALSFRGRKPSDYDPNYENYTLWREGQDCIQLLDLLAVDKALWLGTSRGGLVSIAMAKHYKSRMAGVVLNDIGPDFMPQGMARIFSYLGITPKSQTLDDAARMLADTMAQQFPTLTDKHWKLLASRWFSIDANGVHLNYDYKLRDALLNSVSDFDWWSAFSELSGLPLGVIRGENSDVLSRDCVEKMRCRYPTLIDVEIENRGHAPFVDEPAAIQLIDEVMARSFND